METKEALRICRTVADELNPALKRLSEVLAVASQAEAVTKAIREENIELERQRTVLRGDITDFTKKKKDVKNDCDLAIAAAEKRATNVLAGIKTVHDDTIKVLENDKEGATRQLKDVRREVGIEQQILQNVTKAIAEAKEKARNMAEIANA